MNIEFLVKGLKEHVQQENLAGIGTMGDEQLENPAGMAR